MAYREIDHMAENEPTTQQEQTKTAQDLQIEQLTARLDGLEQAYQDRIKQLEDANRGLWAQLHPVQPTVSEPEPIAEQQNDRAESALYNALGIKLEE